jgi:hypothetical protein
MTKPLTRRTPTPEQISTWDALDRLTLVQVVPPSIRDLMRELGRASTSMTVYRLERGIEAGRVSRVIVNGRRHYVPAWWRRMIVENMRNYYGKMENTTGCES